MKVVKKILAIFLTVVMTVTMLPIMAGAESWPDIEHNYSIKGYYEVNKYVVSLENIDGYEIGTLENLAEFWAKENGLAYFIISISDSENKDNKLSFEVSYFNTGDNYAFARCYKGTKSDYSVKQSLSYDDSTGYYQFNFRLSEESSIEMVKSWKKVDVCIGTKDFRGNIYGYDICKDAQNSGASKVFFKEGNAVYTTTNVNMEQGDTVVGEPASTPSVSDSKKISSLKITSPKSQTYTGKAKTPDVTIKDGDYTLKKGTDYTLTYKNNKKIGKATVTIKGKGKYTGTKSVTFNIVPKKVALKSSKGENKVTLKWTEVKGAEKYQIYYSVNGGKYKKLSTTSKTSKTVSNLNFGKNTYKFKVRAIAEGSDGKTYAGSFSNVKTIKKG